MQQKNQSLIIDHVTLNCHKLISDLSLRNKRQPQDDNVGKRKKQKNDKVFIKSRAVQSTQMSDKSSSNCKKLVEMTAIHMM